MASVPTDLVIQRFFRWETEPAPVPVPCNVRTGLPVLPLYAVLSTVICWLVAPMNTGANWIFMLHEPPTANAPLAPQVELGRMLNAEFAVSVV